MSASSGSETAPAKDSGLGAIALLVIAVAAIVLWWLRPAGPPADQFLGLPRPPLHATGWHNSDGPPSEESLIGKVILLDCFASWCGPCREKMPELVQRYKRFKDEGIVLVGLTPEKGDQLPDAEAYVKSVDGLDWPVGYGADVPLSMLGVDALPTLILFDRTGRSVWAGHDFSGLDEAIVAALAAK